MKMIRRRNRIPAVLLAAALACGAALSAPQPASAAVDTPFTLASAEQTALASSPEISKIYNQILLKQINYTDAVTSIQARIKNKRTLRWTPLLSFKFPEKLNLTDEFDLNVKPQAMTSEITVLQHQMSDAKYVVLEKVRKSYFDVYAAQEKSAFTQEMLTDAEKELARNEARLLAGQAKQADIDKGRQTVQKLTEDLAGQLRAFQTSKQTLADIVKLDLTTGYRFLNPLKDADLTRDQLDGLISHTLSADQGLYEARAAESLALLNLNVAESLMRGKYGGAMNRLNSFISAARGGGSVDYAAFQIQYKQMLVDIDRKWQGNYRILFIKFPKEYLKGQIDGIRYIEDEPYALYTACMEYAAARSDRITAESDLKKRISTDYEALVTARNAYGSLSRFVADSSTALDKLMVLNRIGKADYDEVKSAQEEYQSLQMDAFEALTTYNELLIAFDRLCCGAVTQYFKGIGFKTDAGGGALSFPTGDGQIWYYIYGDVADMTFVFGIDVPDGFEPEVSEYELWYDSQNLSGRVDADQPFRHLTLDYGDTQTLKARLFGSGGFVGEYEIDASEPRGPLPVENVANAQPAENDAVIGSYTVETQVSGSVSTSVLAPKFNANLGAVSYALSYDDANVGGGDPVPATKSFSYLSLLISDLEDVNLLVYGKKDKLICTARFETSDGTIRTSDDV
jgi:outer membrane protein TolC